MNRSMEKFRSGRMRSSASNSQSMGSKIMGNSGINFVTGGLVNCKADDKSFYCTFMKIFNILMVIVIIVAIAYIVYIMTKSTGRRR